MRRLTIGERAPSFRLPSAQGGEVGTDDYRGRANLVLFFAKSMACGFCRQKMSQLARGVARFRALDAEVLQITPSAVARGRFYARNFQLPFPYLCDPDYRVFNGYGLGIRRHSALWKAAVMMKAVRMPEPESDFPVVKPSLREMPTMFNDDDLGFFIVDKHGIIRYAQVEPYIALEGTTPVSSSSIPSNDEIVAALERAQGRSREAMPA